MKKSRRQQEIDARRAADPIAQKMGRDDIDYGSDELPSAPREYLPRFPAHAPAVDRANVAADNARSLTAKFPDVSRPLRFRTPTRCQNGHFRFLFYRVEFGKCRDLVWGEKHADCTCATGGFNEGFAAAGADQQFTGICDKNGKEIFEGDRVRLAGHGEHLVEFPFTQLYEAIFENDIGEILGNIYDDSNS